MPKDLNKLYDFKIRQAIRYSAQHLAVLKLNPISHHDDWSKGCFDCIKDVVKTKYFFSQNRRCAYCRKKLNMLGYFNPIDHVLPKSKYKKWMFVCKNLVVSCEVCNPLKNADDTLSPGHSKRKFPTKKTGFTIFNPHFEKWSDCFEIEDGMFIRGKNKRGEETILACKLYQDNFCSQFADESEVSPKSAIKRASIRTTKFQSGTVEYEAAKSLIDFYKKLI